MLIPDKGSRFKWFVFIWALITVIWMILEGSLGLTVLLGLLTSMLILVFLASKLLSGRHLSWVKWLLVMALSGLLFGLGTAVMTLTLMAIKTGIHAHGPEFSSSETAWVIAQIPLWAVSGLIAGIGLGLLLNAFSNR